jgi:two-component system, chemotaxis family, response regulator Rcp1
MNRQIRILLIEDNEGDIVLTLEALRQARVDNAVDVVRDGEAALAFLHKNGEFVNVATPDLVLLDINLPKMDGTEILSIIKNSNELKMIPVIVLTTSNAEKDIMNSYCNHANCYITKPVDMNNFLQVIQTLKQFWISIVQLPTNQ